MQKTYPIDPENPAADIVNLAATRLRDGGVVVLPTETVYGLAALAEPLTYHGSEELFDIKNRPVELPIPLLVENVSQLTLFGVDVPAYAEKLADVFWPGALTLVVKASDRVQREFQAAEDGTIGLRCPDSVLVRELLDACGPLYCTSANSHGAPTPNRFEDIEPRIIEAADLVLDGGATDRGVASTVVVCTGPTYRIVREGALSAQQIADALV